MNADDRSPADSARPPITQQAAEAPLRRQGVMPPSGSVPQRTAFRPVTGVHSTTQGSASAAPAGARPSTYAPPAQGAGPAAQGQSTQRPAAQAHRAPVPEQAREARLASTAAPAATPASGSFAPVSATQGAPASAATTAASAGTSAAVSATGAPTRSATGAFGIGRLKTAAAETTTGVKVPAKAALPGAPRKVRVLVSRIDPWSALKIGFLMSIAIGIMTVVAAHILWSTLNAMGTFDTIQQWVAKLFGAGQEVNILQFFSYKKDMSAVLLISVVNVMLISGLSVVAAFIYNMISRVVGGVYLTLTDD